MLIIGTAAGVGSAGVGSWDEEGRLLSSEAASWVSRRRGRRRSAEERVEQMGSDFLRGRKSIIIDAFILLLALYLRGSLPLDDVQTSRERRGRRW